MGVACDVILALSVMFWFLCRPRRQNSQTENINQESSSAPISAGPVPELPTTKTWRHPPSELPAGKGQTQELDSVAIHEAGYEANKQEGGGAKELPSRGKSVYK